MLLKCRGLKSVCHFWFHNHEHPAFQDLALLVSILLTQNWACVRSFHNHHMVPRKSFRYLQFPRACSRFKTWIWGWQSFTPGQAIFRGLFPTSPVLSAFIQKMGSISRQADPQWNTSQQIRCYVFWFKMFALAIEVYGSTRFLIISLNIFIIPFYSYSSYLPFFWLISSPLFSANYFQIPSANRIECCPSGEGVLLISNITWSHLQYYLSRPLSTFYQFMSWPYHHTLISFL